MLKIGVCDDIQIYRKTLEYFVCDYFTQKQISYEIHIFSSGTDLQEYYNTNRLDLIFLDIVMDGDDGITAAREIRKKDINVDIIFCTIHSDYAIDCFDVFAYGYMLKPFDFDKFKLLLDHYVMSRELDDDKYLVVKSFYKNVNIPFHRIVYIESSDKNIYIHLLDKSIVKCYGKLSDIYERLSSDSAFLHCHQSFIINMKYILRIDNDIFVTNDNTLIPIRKKELKKMTDIYLQYIS